MLRGRVLTTILAVITQAHVETLTGHLAHAEHREQTTARGGRRHSESYSADEKPEVEQIERV